MRVRDLIEKLSEMDQGAAVGVEIVGGDDEWAGWASVLMTGTPYVRSGVVIVRAMQRSAAPGDWKDPWSGRQPS